MADEKHMPVLAQPVAWRWRRIDESTWVLVDRTPRFINPSHFVVEPLYAAQPPAAPVHQEDAYAASAEAYNAAHFPSSAGIGDEK